MWTFWLMTVSILGTDPAIVDPQIRASTTKPSGWASPAIESEQPGTSSLFPVNTPFSEPSVKPGQALADNFQDTFCESCFDSFFADPDVQQLIAEMNPFVPLNYEVLPNYFDPFGWQMLTGSQGPQGFRLGGSTFNQINLLPASPASGTTGNMKVVEWSSNARFSHLIQPGVLFDGTFWFNARWWDGPGGIAVPGQVDQISTDLLLGLFDDGPWSAQLAFHPQVVNTYDSRLDKNAFNFDGRAIVTYTASTDWRFVGGVAFWDRVDGLIIPSGGVIWTPNNRWEIRALFPKGRISYFLGQWQQADFWVYGQYEYIVEAYQAINSDLGSSDRIQVQDQRITAGLRWDAGRYSVFTETGYVFDRQAKFAGSTPPFSVAPTAIFSVGLRY